MSTIEVTAEQMAAWERGEAIRKVEKWEPKAGGFYLELDGALFSEEPDEALDSQKSFGNTWQTREHAEIAAGYVRKVQRVLNWVFEHYPKWSGENDVSSDSHPIRARDGTWYVAGLITGNTSVQPSLPTKICKHLCRELNAGRVEL